ncbi:MAG: RNB domain-containing ribonuclease [Spirochaetales bacterium]|nr:RNB domain-containing ribonuclease [Spirochaetales bacterium]
MRTSEQIYTGRIVKSQNGYEVKPFVFNGEYTLIPLSIKDQGVKENDIVTYTLVHGDNHGIYQSIIAHADSALADLYAIVEKNKITIPYPGTVLRETEEILQNPHIDDPDLQDFTDKPFITIDNEDSRDLDQAMFIEEIKSGYRIYYALADGAFYIKPGTCLFAEALRRGTTFYFPGFSVPMLPCELSEGILSLNPGVNRRAFIFIMDMDVSGKIFHYQCVQGRIMSRAQLSYNGVQDYYDQPEKSGLTNREFTPVLDLLKTVGEIYIEKTRHMNRVQFQREEPVIYCSDDGAAFEISSEVRNNCSRYNEQLSLMCNMIGAQFLAQDLDPEVQGIYRVHNSPDDKALQELEGTINDIIDSHAITDSSWRWNKGKETLAAYIDRLYTLPGHPRLIEALERQVLVTMRRSMFASTVGDHYALAVHYYSRFSSPMREIVGIFIHKEALAKLGSLKQGSIEEDKKLRDMVIQAGNRSRNIQKTIESQVIESAANRLFQDELTLSPADRTRYPATILGIKQSRLYVRLDSPPIELKVYTEDLETFTGRLLNFDKNRLVCRNTGKVCYRPGDKLILYIESFRKERWRLVPELIKADASMSQ